MYQPQQASNGTSPFKQEGGTAPATNTTTTAAASTEGEGDAVDPPLFRSVAVQPHFNAAFGSGSRKNPFGVKKTPFGNKKTPFTFGGNKGTVRSSFHFTGATLKINEPKLASAQGNDSVLKKWKALAQDQMYVLPCYYAKCERRSATTDQDVEDVLERLYGCFKKLSIQARHESSFATFGLVLRTSEQSELSLLIWYADKARTQLYVEVDKRQSGGGMGGSFPFQYICRILKVVKSSGDMSSNDSGGLPQHKELQSGNSGMAERCRKMDLVVGACAPKSPQPEANPLQFAKAGAAMAPFSTVGDQTLSSLEMAYGLMKKSVTWSHGLELLGTVSDPDKSGIESAKVASKAILLGVSPQPYGDNCCRGIHTALVGLMQSLVGNACDKVSTDHLSPYQKDCLLQLVLTCLVKAMEVHINFMKDAGGMDVTLSMSEGGSSVMSQFLESTKDVVACDIIETLMDIMRRANTKPHHAYLAVKALFLLSSENSSMRQFVSVAMSKEDSQRAALQEAHEVGAQTHGLLEAECERLQRLLSTSTMRH